MKRFWFLAAGLALVAYAVNVYEPAGIFAHPESVSYATFDPVFRDVIRCAILLAFIFLFIAKPVSPSMDASSNRRVQIWSLGFWGVLLLLIALVFYVDPHARYNRGVYLPLKPSARAIKTEFYAQRSSSPDVVILGSSRAFTLSPTYLHEKSGYDTFNMSVEGGRAGDFAVQLNFMQKSAAFPRVLIVDVNPETLSAGFQNIGNQPQTLISYMPLSMGISVGENILRDTISLQSLSDSAYLLGIVARRGWTKTWEFHEDGAGVRKEITHPQYVSLLNTSIRDYTNVMYCTRLEPSAIASFESSLRLAQENNIGVVLYISPVHPEFYRVVRENNPRLFDTCLDVLSQYYRSLSAAYPNVSFTDLLTYEPVIILDENGFYDAVHLRPTAAQLVVDALNPEIQKAMDWALTERSQP